MANVGSHIGTAPLGEEINGVNFSESWLSLSPGADYPKVLDEVRAAASSHPGAFSDVQTYLHERIDEVLTNGTTDDIVVRVYGTDLSKLGTLGNQLAAVLARVPGLTDVHPAALEFIPQVDVQVNLAAAQRYGLTPGVIRRAAAIMMASEPMSEISSGGVLTLVTAWSTPGTRQNLASLRQLQIDTPNGGRVALGQVASITVVPSPSQILRENSQRYTEVDANVSGRSLSSVTGAVRSALAKFRFPAGYRYTLLGEATERAAAQRRLLIEGLAAALIILLLLQAAFGSWRLSFLLFLTLPAALVGGVLAAWGGLGTITLGALVGFFTVLGIAARNGILLISHFRHLEKAEGVPFGPELVIRGASERLSPIMMTALATALALAPAGPLRQPARPGDRVPDGDRDPRRPGHLDPAEPVRAARPVPVGRPTPPGPHRCLRALPVRREHEDAPARGPAGRGQTTSQGNFALLDGPGQLVWGRRGAGQFLHGHDRELPPGAVQEDRIASGPGSKAAPGRASSGSGLVHENPPIPISLNRPPVRFSIGN